MGRIQINFESLTARFPEGTLDRIDTVLRPHEAKAEFIRDAVITKLKMRERGKAPAQGQPENA
jgi:hypothetical protein